MAAAGIRPQPAGMVFLAATLLQQDAPLLVDDENRECPVQQPLLMNGNFARRPKRAVALIDENQGFIVEGAKSFARAGARCGFAHAANLPAALVGDNSW